MPKDPRDKAQLDTSMIKALAELLVSTGLSEIEVEMEREGLRLRVARQVTAMPATALVAAPAAAAPSRMPDAHAPTGAEARPATDPASHPGCVKSPMVGTAYLAPEPGATPFIEVGARVAQGQTVLIIEAMTTMNHIPAPRAGVVTQILVGNSQPVEYGEPMLVIE